MISVECRGSTPVELHANTRGRCCTFLGSLLPGGLFMSASSFSPDSLLFQSCYRGVSAEPEPPRVCLTVPQTAEVLLLGVRKVLCETAPDPLGGSEASETKVVPREKRGGGGDGFLYQPILGKPAVKQSPFRVWSVVCTCVNRNSVHNPVDMCV